ncbi:MAG TPA: grasp-with-spasm system ATP-grasp peptide maturase [Bacteroidetes bacterium]|jgi:ATP-GRASP peptide maturase of grasp-with-spasm system|nr:grasp-with-spasm system ATP-grasp peptide maturase [Bacteroidota bacterium]
MSALNKILIFSNRNDKSTDRVIDWIDYLETGNQFLRINHGDEIELQSINISSQSYGYSFKQNGCLNSFADFKSVWYRRGVLNIKSKIQLSNDKKTAFLSAIKGFQTIEYGFLSNFMLAMLNTKTHVNKYTDIFINKYWALIIAAKHGLTIPESVITNSIKALSSKFNYITKSLTDNRFVYKDERIEMQAGAHTFVIEKENMKSKMFDYSLFQNLINKKFELRVFFLHDKIFASAIFSQNDPKTSIDFRNYNTEKPNRVVPFQLPDNIQFAIRGFMKEVNMNCGSLDIIYNEQKEYVFLEVNPVGQFWQVSYPCNYYLEKEIAKILIGDESKN